MLSTSLPQAVKAEMLNLGSASTGQPITLDTASIPSYGTQGASSGAIFTYYLGRTRFNAEVNCARGEWESGGATHRPQSKATRNMLSIVCSARHREPNAEDKGYMLIFDPPSNLRSRPNGQVACTIDEMVVIPVYAEPNNGWFSTSWCGGTWIHRSQVRPFY